jgi:hypothetical protein
MKHWIKFGDTRVKCLSMEQLACTCRLFNLTLVDDSLFAPSLYRCGTPFCPRAGEVSENANSFCNPVEVEP